MRDSFLLFTEYKEQIEMLSDEQAGALMKAIFCYVADEELPTMDTITKMAFSFIKAAMNRADTSYQRKVEANRENGRLGGRPSKKAEEKTQEETQNNPPETQKPNGYLGFEEKTQEETQKPNGFFENPPNPNPEPKCDPERGVYSAPAREDTPLGRFIERWGVNSSGMDNYSAGKAAGIDWDALSAKVEKSAYLQQQKSLTFYIRHAGEIVEGYYDDFAKPPGGRKRTTEEEREAKMQEYDRLMEANRRKRGGTG